MPYIKVPEFKQNEIIEADKFNEAFGAFELLNLTGENFADESLSLKQIPNDISLTDKTKIGDSFRSIHSFKTIHHAAFSGGDPFANIGEKFTGTRFYNTNIIQNIGETHSPVRLQNLTGGEKFVIRASCVVRTFDCGWRTFQKGIPPILKIGLVRFPGETSVANGSSNSLTTPIYSTLAHYRIAFTGKVPSASSLSFQASSEVSSETKSFRYRDRFTHGADFTYRDTRASNEAGTDGYPSTATDAASQYLPFNGYFSYTTSFLYEHDSSDDPIQSFDLMCHYAGGVAAVYSGSYTTSGGLDGAKIPIPRSAKIGDLDISVYEVKR